MRVISTAEIKEAVRGLCVDSVCSLPPDVLAALQDARDKEEGPARFVLGQIIENEAKARKARRPCCQDTGLAVIFMDVGFDVHIDGDIISAANEGVRMAYDEAYLRKSCLTAIERKNTGDNTPCILHTRYVPGDKVEITVVPKGFGSENMSRLKMLTPADGKEGVIDFIVETAGLGAANACPPIILGVGVGGTMEAAALLAKRLIMRPLGSKAQSDALDKMEKEALKRINELNIGPMGFGGQTTALCVHIGEIPTHLAGLPVAVNVQCHCSRHATAVL